MRLRVFVAFDTTLGPPRTLNYFWANVEPPGTVLEHPRSSRAQIFVLESGNARAGQWIEEQRDISADWKRRCLPERRPKHAQDSGHRSDDRRRQPWV